MFYTCYTFSCVYLNLAKKKLLQLLLIIEILAHYKCLKFSLMLTLQTVSILTLLTTYFQFGGWRYTLFVLTNQNHCYMTKLNYFEFCLIDVGRMLRKLIRICCMNDIVLWIKHCRYYVYINTYSLCPPP